MTSGFFVGMVAGAVLSWILYWQIMGLFARIGLSTESVWRDLFGRTSYEGLLRMREQLDTEIGRRGAPQA